MNYSNDNISIDAFVLLVCNLRRLIIVADYGFHRVQRYQLYKFAFYNKETIDLDYLWIKEELASRGTRAKKLANWQLLPSTIDSIRRINLGHQEINTWCPF